MIVIEIAGDDASTIRQERQSQNVDSQAKLTELRRRCATAKPRRKALHAAERTSDQLEGLLRCRSRLRGIVGALGAASLATTPDAISGVVRVVS